MNDAPTLVTNTQQISEEDFLEHSDNLQVGLQVAALYGADADKGDSVVNMEIDVDWFEMEHIIENLYEINLTQAGIDKINATDNIGPGELVDLEFNLTLTDSNGAQTTLAESVTFTTSNDLHTKNDGVVQIAKSLYRGQSLNIDKDEFGLEADKNVFNLLHYFSDVDTALEIADSATISFFNANNESITFTEGVDYEFSIDRDGTVYFSTAHDLPTGQSNPYYTAKIDFTVDETYNGQVFASEDYEAFLTIRDTIEGYPWHNNHELGYYLKYDITGASDDYVEVDERHKIVNVSTHDGDDVIVVNMMDVFGASDRVRDLTHRRLDGGDGYDVLRIEDFQTFEWSQAWTTKDSANVMIDELQYLKRLKDFIINFLEPNLVQVSDYQSDRYDDPWDGERFDAQWNGLNVYSSSQKTFDPRFSYDSHIKVKNFEALEVETADGIHRIDENIVSEALANYIEKAESDPDVPMFTGMPNYHVFLVEYVDVFMKETVFGSPGDVNEYIDLIV